jgi:hypothetical protein
VRYGESYVEFKPFDLFLVNPNVKSRVRRELRPWRWALQDVVGRRLQNGSPQGLKPVFIGATYAALKAPLFHGGASIHDSFRIL